MAKRSAAKKREAPGTASIPVSSAGSGEAIELELNGQCLRETLLRLEEGGAHGKSMSAAALSAIRPQAEEIAEEIVRHYAERVALDEVGKGGRARATDTPPKAGEAPTGLVYGRVQSGKTAAMIVTTALAVDNGFRVIVVLTSNNLELISQTATRFHALGGPRVVSSDERTTDAYKWEKDRDLIKARMARSGVVFVCAKEDDHLWNLIEFLEDIGAGDYPALIIDDEADHATPDTNQSKRQSKRLRDPSKRPKHGSTTFRLVVGNDHEDEQGKSLREVLPHNVFLQLTATPYGLLLQNMDSALRPAFPKLLKPGQGYTGGEVFFAQASDEQAPPLCYVAEDEGEHLDPNGEAPVGLKKSIAFFLLAAIAHKARYGAPSTGYKHLCHTSPNTAQHRVTAALIRRYCDALLAPLEEDLAAAEMLSEIQFAYRELRLQVPDAPPLTELLRGVREELHRRDVLEINSEGSKLKFQELLTFVVGGNILGRGITIDDLLVTYYLRQAKVSQMDTVLQHARMYGYRVALMPYTRVFLPKSLALRFREIHRSEESLRAAIGDDPNAGSFHVALNLNLRASRPGILDLSRISAYRPGQQVYPYDPVHDPKKTGRGTFARIQALLGELGVTKERQYVEVAIDDIINLIELVPVDSDGSDYDKKMLQQCLRAISQRYDGRGLIYMRRMQRESKRLLNGAISGKVQHEARAQGRPVLFMMWDDDKPTPRRPRSPWRGRFWYPSIVFPKGMPLAVFNRTPDA